MAKGSGLSQKLKPSKELAVILGSSDKIPRGEAVGKFWKYAKKHKLQSEKDGRIIICDDKLLDLFGKAVRDKREFKMRGKKIKVGKGEIFMTEITKQLSNHLE